ncbi:hypothetical protein CRYUN_Cryun27aG0046900 [Craigia yunnanensis]
MRDQTSIKPLSANFNKAKPYFLLVCFQFGSAGMYIISMVTLNHGMNRYVLIVYHNGIAALVLASFALVLERLEHARIKEVRNQAKVIGTPGIVSSGITYYVQGLVMKTKIRGLVFVIAFNPLCMIIVAALGSAILGEQIHLGGYILIHLFSIIQNHFIFMYNTIQDTKKLKF